MKKHNFMLDNVKINEKLTTQPDLTNERSLDILEGKLETEENHKKLISVSHKKEKR